MEISPSQWERVKELYEAALRRGAPEREAFLQSESDEHVRSEVARLLKEQERLGSFLSTSPFADRGVSKEPERERIPAGEMLAGRFRILGFIAAGGMGEVYKAEDTRLDRTVALKFLPKELAEDRSALERLRREAKAASALNHPNICTVYDFGEDDGRAFIAMEYLEGETLSTRIKRGPLPVEEVLRIGRAVTGALRTAHRRGIVHRDLKPGNVMLTETEVKLLDFGLAQSERPVAPSDETVTLLTGEPGIAGTLPYMSPEQLHGGEVDARCDIFAFGAVLYEMLTGKRAFERRSSSETILAVDREEPPPVRELVQEVPEDLEKVVGRCLRKKPEERYASIAEIETELEQCRERLEEPVTGINVKVLLRRSKRPSVAIPMALAVALLVAGSLWITNRAKKVRWAREVALPQIARLADQERFAEAYSLAAQAERFLPKDPILTKLWDRISWTDDIVTVPPGVAVYRKDYAARDDSWEFLGTTPIKGRKFPAVPSKWKYQSQGYSTVERATFPNAPLSLSMDQESNAPVGMVKVQLSTPESKTSPVGLYFIGYEILPRVALADFWLDRFEVTNAAYKRFVDAGGYQKQEYWKHEFRKDGHVLSWAEAMKLLQDNTGRSAPANWIQAEYPRGQQDYPVTGVSWYEAAAYAEFVGKSLPTIYHWTAAASIGASASIVPESNFGGVGPSAVGTYHGMSRAGTFDMAGNVKEWIQNEDASGRRYILGGAWNEPSYMFFDPDMRSPIARSENFGFRCAKYSLEGDQRKAADVIHVQLRDISAEKPVSEQVFQAYKRLYSYDKTPLHAVVESVQETGDWRKEKITFAAAYGNERVIVYLFLPKNASPPFQTVVHFTGSAAFYERSSANLDADYVEDFDFVVKSGRAVVFPVYKGMFERWDDFKRLPKDTLVYREHLIDWSKDLGRSIDYLETRPDIDCGKLAFQGTSFGAAIGAILPAIEDRLKVLVLESPGFTLYKQLPEGDQLNFAPRVRAPVLFLNGRFDNWYPPHSSQETLFRLFGTPGRDKRRVVYDTGHDIPRPELIKETLNWLDKYLGPVR